MPEPIESSLPCGCRVAIEDDELHVYPCPHPQHDRMLTTIAEDLAAHHSIPLDVAVDRVRRAR